MSRPAQFTPRARVAFTDALKTLAAESPKAARRLQQSVRASAQLIGDRPEIGRRDISLLSGAFRIWRVKGFPYLLIYIAAAKPPQIVQFVHAARNLPSVLSVIAELPDA